MCRKCLIANSSFLTMGCMAGKTLRVCKYLARTLLPYILQWREVPRQEEGRFPHTALCLGARFIFSLVRCWPWLELLSDAFSRHPPVLWLCDLPPCSWRSEWASWKHNTGWEQFIFLRMNEWAKVDLIWKLGKFHPASTGSFERGGGWLKFPSLLICGTLFLLNLLFLGKKRKKKCEKWGRKRKKGNKERRKNGGLSLVGSPEAPLMLLLPSDQRKTSWVILLNLMQLLAVPKPQA